MEGKEKDENVTNRADGERNCIPFSYRWGLSAFLVYCAGYALLNWRRHTH